MLWSYYLIITAVLILLLCIGGMDVFDSVCQAFATVSTGGFSTKAASISYWTSPSFRYVLIFFMLFCSLNFSVTFFLFNGKPRQALRDEECRNFLMFVGGFVAFHLCSQSIHQYQLGNGNSLPQICLHDFYCHVEHWVLYRRHYGVEHSYMADIHCSNAIGWMFRFSVRWTKDGEGIGAGQNSYAEFKRLLHPNAMIPLKFNKKAIDAEIINNALAFVSLYIGITLISIVAMSSLGWHQPKQ